MNVVLAAMALLAGAQSAPVRLAFHPLSSPDAGADVLQQLNAAVSGELQRLDLELVPGERMEKALRRPCDGDLGCLVRLGRELGAQEVLEGNVRRLGDSFAVTMRLVDVETGAEVASAAESVNRDVEEMVWAMRAQVTKLKAPERSAGRLQLEAPKAAKLWLDGAAAPREPVVLRPGTYAVRSELEGRRHEDWVQVRTEQTATATLDPRRGKFEVTYAPWAPPAGLVLPSNGPRGRPIGAGVVLEEEGWPRWPGFAGLGLGGALVAGGIVQQLRAAGMVEDARALRGGNSGLPDHPEIHRQVGELSQRLAFARTSGWLLLGAGAAMAAAGGGWLVFAPATSGEGGSVAVTGSF